MRLQLAHTGRLADLSTDEKAAILERGEAIPQEVRKRVEQMATRIRERGDAALETYTQRFDDVRLDDIVVPQREQEDALKQAPPAFIDAFQTAVEQIRGYHEAQQDEHATVFEARGVQASERVVPLDRVGVYVPGGTAAYPSTVAMTVVPAQAAGVGEITVSSPPGPDGTPHELVLAACQLLEVDRVIALGGAQAILALAHGSQTLPPHDTVVGPGNIYVQAAKQLVAGRVRIDAPAGPSEIAVLADGTANPHAIARELVAQAEHDPRAIAVGLLEGEALVKEVHQALEDTLDGLARRDVVEQALASSGALLTVEDTEQACTFIDEMAPEHCALLHEEAQTIAEELQGPACIVAGLRPRVALTDYVAGPSHVLPTGGHARAHSGINLSTFTRRVHVATLNEVDTELVDAAIQLARMEGLDAHAKALEEDGS